MTSEAHFAKIEHIFNTNPCNQNDKPRIHVTHGSATIELDVRPHMLHGGGVVHGSVYFKLLDDAATFSVASIVDDEVYVTASFTIHFLRPVATGQIIATGKILDRSRRRVLAEAVAVDENGRVLARGSGTFMRASRA